MAGKRRLSHCPNGCSGGKVPKQVQRTRKNPDGATESYTETVMVDCPVCDGSGTVVDWS